MLAPVPPRVFLHVGLHKSGTTYLQNFWRKNREDLAAQGVHYPGGPGEPIQRMAAYDLLGRRPRRTDDHRVPGQWQALVDTVTASPHPTVLISDEVLIFGTSRQAASVVEQFAGREVHVMITARDLGRVLVSAWQEEVKNDHSWTWPDYISAVKDPQQRTKNPGRGFWRAQDLPTILATWAGAVPPGRIHVVTVPPSGGPRDELLRRAGKVVGFDPDLLTETPRWDNASLGVAGTEVVRRLNLRLDHRLNERQHSFLIKRTIAPKLVHAATDAKYALPEEELGWVQAEARHHIEEIKRGGFQVTGDIDDLLPAPPERNSRRPDEVTTDELLDAAMVALEAVSERYATRWWRKRRLDPPVIEPTSRWVRVSSAARSASFRSRRAAADLADHNRFAAKGIDVYLKITERQRGSTSKPAPSLDSGGPPSTPG